MKYHGLARGFAIAAGTALMFALAAPAARAQDVSESHMAEAKAVVAAIGATDAFDNILLNGAEALKVELIKKDPDLQELIVNTVDETAISLASRRGDLENEAARVYASNFSEEELVKIKEFYTSDVGVKLRAQAPLLLRSVNEAAQVWQNGLARDLAQQAGEKLAAAIAATRPADAPAEGGNAEGGDQAPKN